MGIGSVQASLLNIVEHALHRQITDRLPRRYASAQVAGRDGQRRHLEVVDGEVAVLGDERPPLLRQRVAGARDRYGTKHSEAIVAEDEAAVEAFLARVDAAAVYANASTAFTDGAEFGLGAEIGISTQKLHARGPFALDALTSYKYVLRGSGQVRA